ncbi:MAG: TldD/PmbA family protein [Candidatus Edwardsbacteria bacterium]|nr:TldD/PmbA family protein [Candidatus Edwardsbacteria bacterium]MBU1575869.1 TldD/PmbA family protein [Candidatus Edwardsbacteria bacterium]MBU2464359.1 TldD/PmbA family protein [Candidatus Edwardsbacteria bacterium]MBU2593083.1 TldD/PmbA family protein [Candidatus Edwardsbacteria bacterium]
MKKTLSILFVAFLLSGTASSEEKPSAVISALSHQIEINLPILQKAPGDKPYFIGYRVTEEEKYTVNGSFGAVTEERSLKERAGMVDVRVGSMQLDNTHNIREGWGYWGSGKFDLPAEDDQAALESVLWWYTDKTFKQAQKGFDAVKANLAVKVEEEDQSDDFSPAPVVVSLSAPAKLDIDQAWWKQRVMDISKLFDGYSDIYKSEVAFAVAAENNYIVNSEGTKISHGRIRCRLHLYISTVAEDGMDLYRYEAFDARSADGLPDEAAIKATAQKMISELAALRNAPLAEPHVGPAIMCNRASAVFYHEILGHRVEGHRQKDVTEGQTFKKKVGQTILPGFISVFDDPSLSSFRGLNLMGDYPYDDEGVASERVTIIEKGTLKNFLMSRSPIAGFEYSNGHGRGTIGQAPVSRMGNTIISSQQTVSFAALKKLLMAEVKKQKKPYGLIFTDISGGFTMTSTYMPQSFKVLPVMVYKIYPDGREELVRGIDISGTPLTVFSKITATADDYDVFSGFCGAESGYLPVSCVSPSILIREMEVEKRMMEQDKPPILPQPMELRKGDGQNEK